jgi:Trk-type K+ transport system membrane component
MKERTQDFIIQAMVIIGIAGFFFMLFGGVGYMIYQDTMQKERMYGKCIDTCERVFQEQRLIDCIQTCNTMDGINQTVGGSG